MKLVIITGMPGAGKSEVAEGFRQIGVPVIVMGDVIRNETKRRGMDPNPENTKKVMLDLRETDGLGAVAMRCVDQIRSQSEKIVAIEGCRSIAEIDVFDDFADNVTVVCVHTRPKLRFERLRTRKREDAPTTWDVFRERDLREISVGLGGVIALSDIMIINEESLDSFQDQVRLLVQRLSQS